MTTIDKKTKNLFSDLNKEPTPKGFTKLIMDQIGVEKTYTPLISKQVLIFAFGLFFIPPIAMMFFLDGASTNIAFATKISQSINSILSYKNLEIYMVLGILLFWLYFFLENTFSYVIKE